MEIPVEQGGAISEDEVTGMKLHNLAAVFACHE
jgi:hypothetical protein